ncbi:hypothetical protein INT46_007014 [Mucor plumbeus]|uniref:Uncharacterized protein n=1 Tax=Mucor plumbeus TaxID=97098 RepID=A0A8H7R3W2_9FUNG|nr:hypothetical protein INT46_007014 [Mucor plumbeus]
MNSQGAKLEELVEKTHQATTEEERKQVAEQANKIHEKVTGHAMTVDEHGYIKTNSEEAKQEEELKNIKMNRVPAASVSNLYCLDMQ